MHPQRFVLDASLGRLGRHLRLIGLDVIWDEELEHDDLLEAAREDGRLLLTADAGLHAEAGPELSHLVVAEGPGPQLKDVCERFGLTQSVLEGRGFLSRCLDCNSTILPATGHQVHDRIPGSVLLEHAKFYLCPRCERVYWEGGPFEAMRAWVRSSLAY